MPSPIRVSNKSESWNRAVRLEPSSRAGICESRRHARTWHIRVYLPILKRTRRDQSPDLPSCFPILSCDDFNEHQSNSQALTRIMILVAQIIIHVTSVGCLSRFLSSFFLTLLQNVLTKIQDRRVEQETKCQSSQYLSHRLASRTVHRSSSYVTFF